MREIDDLLADLEDLDDFAKPPSKSSTRSVQAYEAKPPYQASFQPEYRAETKSYSSTRPEPTKTAAPTYGKANTLDDLLESMADIEHDDFDFRPAPVTVQSTAPAAKKLRKCFPLFVGIGEAGLCQGSQRPKVCDKLRCTDCDLEVKKFLGAVWDRSVDYLFFRNNYSREDQLRLNLHPQSGSVAYSCQCKWHSWSGVERAPDHSWVCGGHYC
eukprot:CAMPEP_0204896410 /NCGR_PEP_ID=MMETSP1397-20131031/145_1 /ASSEMBLY_ACC=CAM_ASM_000891 /TAXON_ID=49980 /ORGANISM="Climacostomum Climacostomum virens, Strain Stock W-24" /LENGTH=212 /DNA_ID=CAMNT_0052064013 /DNA_START=1088 /DNA_END=1726 /DNA_ORIENTATION=-